jgi:hypothetical protein
MINLQPGQPKTRPDFPGSTFLHLAADGTRTHDLVLTKDALYQLSYSSDIESFFSCSPADPTTDTRSAPVRPSSDRSKRPFCFANTQTILVTMQTGYSIKAMMELQTEKTRKTQKT